MIKKICEAIVVAAFFFLPQIVNGQLIKEEFNSLAFSDQFDDDRDNWRNMSTSDNLFMIQDGEYVLRRKNTASGYSIFPKWKNSLTAFSLVAALKLEDSKNDESSIGLIFMAQEDATGAFVFELNPKGQYRLKQLVGLSYKLLTGEGKTGGWVTSDVVHKVGEYNLVEIKTSKRNYDVYVNEKYLLSFTEIAYKTGDIGISIGASTKARVDYIAVKEPRATAIKNTASILSPAEEGSKPSTTDTSTPGTASSDMMQRLIEQVASLKLENQSLRDSVNLLKKQLKAATTPVQQQK